MQNLLQLKQRVLLGAFTFAASQSYGSGGYNTQTYGGKTFKIGNAHFHLTFGWVLVFVLSSIALLVGITLLVVARRRRDDNNNRPSNPTLIAPGS